MHFRPIRTGIRLSESSPQKRQVIDPYASDKTYVCSAFVKHDLASLHRASLRKDMEKGIFCCR